MFTFSPDPRKNADAAPVVEKFRAAKVEPEGYVLYAYAAMQLFEQAATAAKSTKYADLEKALRGQLVVAQHGPDGLEVLTGLQIPGVLDALYAEALQFCYGYISGAAQFHNALVGEGGLRPLACPTEEPTRREFAEYFVNWARTTATPEQLAEPAVQGMARAAVAKWPCPR